MKSDFCLAVLFTLLFSVHLYADEKQVPVEGKWGDERVRTSALEYPVVYVTNNVLSIYLSDTLENLAIVILDSNGLVVYQDCISSCGSSYTHMIDLNRLSGSIQS
jgi:hypothetical protein